VSSAEVDRAVRPLAGPARPLVLPGFERLEAAGALPLWFARRPGVPEVSVRLVLEAGASDEPAAEAGLAELTTRLLTEGTAERDAQAMARWLDRLGVGFDAAAGYAVALLSLHTLTDVLEEAIGFLAEVVRRPTFPDAEVKRIRSERLDEIERQRDEPAIVADHALIGELYGDGLYGRPVGGTRETVAAIDAASIRGFHERRYRPGRAFLLACGDVDPGRVAAAVSERFGDWEGEVPAPFVPPPPPPTARRVILIDRPDSAQAEVRVATIGVPFGTPDHHAIILANAVLGGLFNSRINMNLREDKGWTYGARSSFRFRRGAGPFVARTAVETAVTAPAFEEILGEIERMRSEPVSEEELELARHALTLSLPLQFETAAQITRKVSRQRIYGLPEDYWETFRERLEAVTPDEVTATCRRYLDPDRLVLLAVTDATATAAAMETLGEVRIEPFA